MNEGVITVSSPPDLSVDESSDWNASSWATDFPFSGLPNSDSIDPDVGYIVLRTPQIAEQEASLQATWITALASRFGRLFRVFGSQSALWRTLDVNLDRPSTRSRGTGSQPLHLDFVNTSSPPDYVFLYCERSDPAGGGASILASVAGIRDQLSSAAVEALSRSVFSDGEARNLLGVGDDVNPFPIFQTDSDLALRFTGRLLDLKLEPSVTKALEELQTVISERTRAVQLAPGDLLVVDQRHALHGRAALGPGQNRFPPDERRLLRHAFGRAKSENGLS